MPLPSLPVELHILILEQLVEPISHERFPPHYEYLRLAALVCKDWTKVAQRLLWQQVYLVVTANPLDRFLAGVSKEDRHVDVLVVQMPRPGTQHADLFSLKNHQKLSSCIRRCTTTRRLVCAYPYLFAAACGAPTFQEAFPGLISYETDTPTDQPVKEGAPCFSNLRHLAFLTRRDETHKLVVQQLLEQQLAPRLESLKLTSHAVVKQLLPFATSLTALTLPRLSTFHGEDSEAVQAAVTAEAEHRQYLLDTFLPACTSLRHLSLPYVWSPVLLASTSPSLERLTVLEFYAVDLPTLEQHVVDLDPSAPLKVIRLYGANDEWIVGELHEETKKLRGLCESRGI
ncbi:hypothetical protein JCM10213_009094 [Rhodosporidiobolus nylandii]